MLKTGWKRGCDCRATFQKANFVLTVVLSKIKSLFQMCCLESQRKVFTGMFICIFYFVIVKSGFYML